MKRNPVLPKILKIAFGVFEGIAVLGVVIVLGLVWFSPNLPGNSFYDLGEIGFVPQTPVNLEGVADQVQIRRLQGRVTIQGGLDSSVRWAIAPLILLHGAFFLALCDFMRRLFRNVERRESFSAGNIRLVRRVGLLILLFTLLSAVTNSYYEHRVLKYLGPSARLMDQEVLLTPAFPDNAAFSATSAQFQFSLNFSLLLAGFIVLALSEVFRQGRQLEEDSQLTI